MVFQYARYGHRFVSGTSGTALVDYALLLAVISFLTVTSLSILHLSWPLEDAAWKIAGGGSKTTQRIGNCTGDFEPAPSRQPAPGKKR